MHQEKERKSRPNKLHPCKRDFSQSIICEDNNGAKKVSKGEEPIWKKEETCYFSLNEQGGEVWKKLREGCIQASLISQICERTTHNKNFPKKTPEELALTLCGLTKSSYTPSIKLAMEDGIIGEPIIRNWFSESVLKEPIKEVGVAVWNKDPFFRASLDGEVDVGGIKSAIEIKIPQKFNSKYREVFHSWGKGVSNPHPDSYIFRNHYDQMTTGSVITDKNGCYYVVACINDGTSFYQYIDTDWDLWEKTLYPKAKAFHTKHVIPLIESGEVDVIFPPQV